MNVECDGCHKPIEMHEKVLRISTGYFQQEPITKGSRLSFKSYDMTLNYFSHGNSTCLKKVTDMLEQTKRVT